MESPVTANSEDMFPSILFTVQRFRPLTVEKPKVLLPLVNVPLINYTLEWLVASGVDEVSLQSSSGAGPRSHGGACVGGALTSCIAAPLSAPSAVAVSRSRSYS